MKKVIMSLALSFFAVAAFAQCDALTAKSYVLTLKLAGHKGDTYTYMLQIENKSNNNLSLEFAFWGKPDGSVKQPEVIMDKQTFTIGKKQSTSKTIKSDKNLFGEFKVKVTNKDCQDDSKNTFTDPTFYKLK